MQGRFPPRFGGEPKVLRARARQEGSLEAEGGSQPGVKGGDKVERLSKPSKWQKQREGRPTGPNVYPDPSCGGAARATRHGAEERSEEEQSDAGPTWVVGWRMSRIWRMWKMWRMWGSGGRDVAEDVEGVENVEDGEDVEDVEDLEDVEDVENV